MQGCGECVGDDCVAFVFGEIVLFARVVVGVPAVRDRLHQTLMEL